MVEIGAIDAFEATLDTHNPLTALERGKTAFVVIIMFAHEI